jgi:pyrroline-5-carboxylate reductase
MKATVFLGGGRITGAMIAGLRRAHYSTPIIVHDRHAAKLRQMQRTLGIVPEINLERAVSSAALLIVAVRPNSVFQLLSDIGHLDRPLIAISLAAGVPLSQLRKKLPRPVQWARAMPSPLCRTGRGLTAIAFDRSVSSPSRKLVRDLFAAVGNVFELPEKQFDAFTVTYSSSHGSHALATLSAAARKLGLDRKTALMAATHALCDGISSFQPSNIRLDDSILSELIAEAATPGGIAATVMATMDRAGYRRVVEKGLRAGIARAKSYARERN